MHNKSSLPYYKVIDGKKVFMSEDDVQKLKKLKIQNKKRERQIKMKINEQKKEEEKLHEKQIVEKQKKF